MALDVQVTIDHKKVMMGAGFGVPLLYAAFCQLPVRYTECENLDDVAVHFDENTELHRLAKVLFSQPLPPQKIAIFGCASGALEPDGLPAVWHHNWRALVPATNPDDADQDALLQELAAYVDGHGDKVLFGGVQNLPAALEHGELTGYERLFCLYEPSDAAAAVAAVVGATAGLKAGSFTYKNCAVQGVTPADLTAEEVQQASDAGCVCLVEKAGDLVTSGGATAGGEYLDVIDAKDYIIAEIEYRTQQALNQNAKIPYDNNGIALLESICYNVLAEAFSQGIIAVTDDKLPDFSVNYAPRSETSAEDRLARRYVEGRFSFALAGAVHTARVHGTIFI